MSSQNMNKKSWESLSSTFSQLEISISHDSCYASDEYSAPITTTTAPNPFGAPALVPAITAPLQSILKPILKRPYSEIEEAEESESGYASEESDYDYDDNFDESDDDMSEVSEWDEISDTMSQSDVEDDDAASLDGSLIIEFGAHVQFDANIRYIEAPELEEDESPEAGLTCHELMELARASGTLRLQEGTGPGDHPDDYEGDDSLILETLKQLPEEHPDDAVDLDKSLFVAYMNGINGLNDPGYRSRLRCRADDIKSGRAQTPYLDEDGTTGAYIDNALNHVIGLFRNIVAQEEFNELVDLSHVKGTSTGPGESVINQKLLTKLENILSERLASDAVNIGPDELSFFASGVAYALDHWNCYMTG